LIDTDGGMTMMLRTIGLLISSASLVLAGAVPAPAAMGQGPGHDLPNALGVNVTAHADTAEYVLAFTAHTSKTGVAHGSIDFTAAGVSISNLDLRRLAFMDEETAASGGCDHGAMIIARGSALLGGTEQVKVWVDLQDRDDGDRARIRAMAMTDHEGHDHATGPGGAGSPGGGPGADGHTDAHGGCSDGGSPWLYRSHWFEVRDVAVHVKGYARAP
jgi:hypothetical protein